MRKISKKKTVKIEQYKRDKNKINKNKNKIINKKNNNNE
jgi:hypothetical protein